MVIRNKLKGVENKLIRDAKETTLSLSQLAEKYGVSKQGISIFIHRKGIKRLKLPEKEHIETCSICQSLLKIANKRHSDFISSRTIKEQLRLGRGKWRYHICILRNKGLISQRFGRLFSRKVELAYQIYFDKGLPVKRIGKQVGLKNLRSVIKKHKALGWDVPDSNRSERRCKVLKTMRRKKGVRMKKLTKKIAKKDEVGELKREVSRLKRESNAMIKKLELQVKSQEEDIQEKGAEIEKLKTQLEKKRKDLSQLKKENASKINELELRVEELTEKLGKRDKELQASKELLDRKDVDLNRLREEVEYKNTQLASKDMEMESYKKVTDEKVFQLDAKVKELEGKAGLPPVSP